MFRSAILKLTAACNLNCSYCYMFNQNDKTYTRVPGLMPQAVARQALRRIGEHMAHHSVKKFSLVLHGGEPTLWPFESFRALLEDIAALRQRTGHLDVSLQTNAYRFDPDLLHLLSEHGVSVGISIDGPKPYHDRYRVDHRGEGTYDRVMATVEQMLDQGYKHLIGGFLTVANPDIPPTEYLDWVRRLPVPRASVLWPIEFNYDNPPWTAQTFDDYIRKPPYGLWFAELFREWWRRDDPQIYIRLFFDVIHRVLGGRTHGDSIGNDVNDMLVINTDGAIEYPDYYRAHADGGSRTSYTIFDHSLGDLAHDPVFNFNLHMADFLPEPCTRCPHQNLCGGGFLPGRMSKGSLPPQHKSVLCFDHYYFYTTVQEILAPHLGNRERQTPGDDIRAQLGNPV